MAEKPSAAVEPPRKINARQRWKALANALDVDQEAARATLSKEAEVVTNKRWSLSQGQDKDILAKKEPAFNYVPKYLEKLDHIEEVLVGKSSGDVDHVPANEQRKASLQPTTAKTQDNAQDALMALAANEHSAEEAIQIAHMQRKFKALKFITRLRAKTTNKVAAEKHLIEDSIRDDFISESERHFLFDDSAVRRGGAINELFNIAEDPEEDFNEVVDQDDTRIETYVSVELVGKMLESMYFRIFIFGLILVNSILIGIQANDRISVEYRYLFSIFDHMVLAIFVCEILVKWYHGFWIFWQVGWNILDFIIIGALLLGPQLSFLSSSRILRILRVLRAFRSLRSISALAGLSMVVQTILQSIPDMANIVLLLTLILLMLGVIGVTLFGKVMREFGDLQTAMFTLFICVTQDGWVGIFNKFRDTEDTMTKILGIGYFLVSICLGAFIFANLIVAVVVTNLELAMNELNAEKRSQIDIMATTDVNEGITDHELVENPGKVPIISFIDAQKDVDFNNQAPLQHTDFRTLSPERLEKYFIVLSAFEDNLAEYITIKGDLIKMYDVIRGVNTIDANGLDNMNSDFKQGIAAAYNAAQLPTTGSGFNLSNLKKGDIMSNLMEIQEHMSGQGSNVRNLTDVVRKTKSVIRTEGQKRRNQRKATIYPIRRESQESLN